MLRVRVIVMCMLRWFVRDMVLVLAAGPVILMVVVMVMVMALVC